MSESDIAGSGHIMLARYENDSMEPVRHAQCVCCVCRVYCGFWVCHVYHWGEADPFDITSSHVLCVSSNTYTVDLMQIKLIVFCAFDSFMNLLHTYI